MRRRIRDGNPQISVRLNPELQNALHAYCIRTGTPVSDLVRKAIVAVIQPSRPELAEIDKERGRFISPYTAPKPNRAVAPSARARMSWDAAVAARSEPPHKDAMGASEEQPASSGHFSERATRSLIGGKPIR
jgi:Ribbon-helix-helix domain